MATTWQKITVRVERPPETPLGDYFADMRSWLDHHCIMLADFRNVAAVNKSGVFDVLFDNPRDALLFQRRFARQPTSRLPVPIVSRPSIVTLPSIKQSWISIPGVIAGLALAAFRIRMRFAPKRIARDPASAIDLPITG